MAGFVDLHCHWVAGVDDGAPTTEDSRAMLEGLGKLGFERVIATPHMRPALFDNQASDLRAAYDRTWSALQGGAALPELGLSCEHFFDEVVFRRLRSGEGLPYPGAAAVLLEFYESSFPPSLDRLLSELRRAGLTPVIAHPERYHAVWERPEILDRLLDLGAVALLDIAALAGKYGTRPRRSAELLLERGVYHAACSDAHRPEDMADVARGMQLVRERYGEPELSLLLRDGPLEILAGTARS
jgi:protein-tyrosine phosphatase